MVINRVHSGDITATLHVTPEHPLVLNSNGCFHFKRQCGPQSAISNVAYMWVYKCNMGNIVGITP